MDEESYANEALWVNLREAEMNQYDYDAYGTLIAFRQLDATTASMNSLHPDTFALNSSNRYLFAGEQYDSDLGMYYLRARYLNTHSGRFHSMDTYEGRTGEPQTLHKYLYAHDNPVSNIDPSGNFSLTTLSLNVQIGALRAGIAITRFASLPKTIGIVKGLLLTSAITGVILDPYAAYSDFRDSVGALGPLGVIEGVRLTSLRNVKALGRISKFFSGRASPRERLEEFQKIVSPQLRKILDIGRGRTLAYGEMEINGSLISKPSASGPSGHSSLAPVVTKPRLRATSNRAGQTPADRDAEYKLLEYYAEIIETSGSRPTKITIWVDNLPTCSSCSDVILQFQAKYGIKVDVVAPGRF